jgi:Flp pilus assembly protein TadD
MHMRRTVLFAGGLLLTLSPAACEEGSGLPDPGSEPYIRAVAAFYSGVAALQAGEPGLAESSFRRVTELAPAEPAAWADLGLTAVARRQPDAAAEAVDRALTLAPEEARVHVIAALVARERDQLDAAVEHLRRRSA